MENYKLLERKLWNAIIVLTSGILTNLIYDEVSNTSYLFQTEDKQFTISQVSESLWKSIFVTVFTFFIIWITILIISTITLKFIRRFHFKKVTKHSRKNLILSFERIKEETLNLEAIYPIENSNLANTNIIKLRLKSLATIITDLHRLFCPHNIKLKQSVKNLFRNYEHTSIINISEKISAYEFLSLISLLEEMISITENHSENDYLLIRDCTEMKSMLSELKTICTY